MEKVDSKRERSNDPSGNDTRVAKAQRDEGEANAGRPGNKKPSLRVVAQLIRAANRFKNSFNPTYTPGKKHTEEVVVPQNRGHKAALIMGGISEEKGRGAMAKSPPSSKGFASQPNRLGSNRNHATSPSSAGAVAAPAPAAAAAPPRSSAALAVEKPAPASVAVSDK